MLMTKQRSLFADYFSDQIQFLDRTAIKYVEVESFKCCLWVFNEFFLSPSEVLRHLFGLRVPPDHPKRRTWCCDEDNKKPRDKTCGREYLRRIIVGQKLL